MHLFHLLVPIFLLQSIAQTIFGFPQLPTPSQRQFAWQQREVEALIHFGINTFTAQEWGSGSERPALFNPTDFDPDQWVLAAKAFNAKSITLVAKHHDGFCLWPSKYTDYSVKKSPWRNGNGDLVRELSDACHTAGIGFGIYLSPGDRHEPTFGRNSFRYNDFFCHQLTELLSNYGEITQVFLDGAQPVRDRKQEYDWPRYYKIIRELQPNAVITVYGPDVRWVGNEDGIARDSEWSVIPLPVPPELFEWKDMTAKDLGSNEKIENAKYLHWYPAAADVSIRRGWFWNKATDFSVKTPAQLLDIYEKSVGRNACLQLNITPDTTGRIPDRDLASLQEFGNLTARPVSSLVSRRMILVSRCLAWKL